MTVPGELIINLNQHQNRVDSSISSSRPTHAARLFTGKSIEQTIQTLPLLFSICGKAQTITAVRAIESAQQRPATDAIESHRQALVTLESLREHSLHILKDWPIFINEEVRYSDISTISSDFNTIFWSIDFKQLLNSRLKSKDITSEQKRIWQRYKENLIKLIFADSQVDWNPSTLEQIDDWAEKQQTTAGRLIYWLQQQPWQHAGSSTISLLPDIDQAQLITRLCNKQENFVAQPDWQSQCYESSWLNQQQHQPLVSQAIAQFGNGIYTRLIARLITVAELIKQLDIFFTDQQHLNSPISKQTGLAHIDAARGRLTHYVELEADTIIDLHILAPTEWNFHPQGVAAHSLRSLDNSDVDLLRLQADLLIHAIDPCVGYQLHINNEVTH